MSEPGPSAGDRVLAAAAERAERTRALNVPQLDGLPVPGDTANLRQGPDLHPALLALLPMVGVWRGTGDADYPTIEPHRFGQQVVVAHDGRGFLTWESRSWLLDDAGEVVRPAARESGFWRVVPAGPEDEAGEDSIELLLAHNTGLLELFYGRALTQSSWELSTDVVLRTQTAKEVTGAHRLYGIVEGGDLGFVEERAMVGQPLQPHLSARLERIAG